MYLDGKSTRTVHYTWSLFADVMTYIICKEHLKLYQHLV